MNNGEANITKQSSFHLETFSLDDAAKIRDQKQKQTNNGKSKYGTLVSNENVEIQIVDIIM
jgi:hypothetical protein